MVIRCTKVHLVPNFRCTNVYLALNIRCTKVLMAPIIRCTRVYLALQVCRLGHLSHYSHLCDKQLTAIFLLAPSGALIAIPTY